MIATTISKAALTHLIALYFVTAIWKTPLGV
jgi:hypothetical protein